MTEADTPLREKGVITDELEHRRRERERREAAIRQVLELDTSADAKVIEHRSVISAGVKNKAEHSINSAKSETVDAKATTPLRAKLGSLLPLRQIAPSFEMSETVTIIDEHSDDIGPAFELMEEADNLAEAQDTAAVEVDYFAGWVGLETGAGSGLVERETQEPASPEQIATAWGAELAKEPAEIYEDFLEVLLAFGESFVVAEGTDPENVDEAAGVAESSEKTEVTAVVTIVTEALAELETEQQAEVALILRDIVGAVHGIKLLEARQASSEKIAEVRMQLEELCATLFESLDKYDEEMVRQFVAIMLDPEFKFIPESQEELDLERAGTHEVKRRFGRLASGLSQVEDHLQKAIGGSALAAA